MSPGANSEAGREKQKRLWEDSKQNLQNRESQKIEIDPQENLYRIETIRGRGRGTLISHLINN